MEPTPFVDEPKVHNMLKSFAELDLAKALYRQRPKAVPTSNTQLEFVALGTTAFQIHALAQH
jgi:hypothetical protein